MVESTQAITYQSCFDCCRCRSVSVATDYPSVAINTTTDDSPTQQRYRCPDDEYYDRLEQPGDVAHWH